MYVPPPRNYSVLAAHCMYSMKEHNKTVQKSKFWHPTELSYFCLSRAGELCMCRRQETTQFLLLTACTPWRDKIKLSKNQSFATRLCWVICAWAGQESYVCAAAKKLLSSCCSLHVARGPVTSVKWPSLRLLCYSSRTTDSQWEFFKISQMFLTIGHNIIILFSTDAFARREYSLSLPPVKEGKGIIQL